jgi:hypothetical protein
VASERLVGDGPHEVRQELGDPTPLPVGPDPGVDLGHDVLGQNPITAQPEGEPCQLLMVIGNGIAEGVADRSCVSWRRLPQVRCLRTAR